MQNDDQIIVKDVPILMKIYGLYYGISNYVMTIGVVLISLLAFLPANKIDSGTSHYVIAVQLILLIGLTAFHFYVVNVGGRLAAQYEGRIDDALAKLDRKVRKRLLLECRKMSPAEKKAFLEKKLGLN